MSPGTPDSTGSFAAVVTLESVDERVAGEAPAQRDVLAHAVHPHAVPVELEVDFVSRLEAQHIPKPLRNHDLPLRPYPGSHTSEYNRRRGRRSALQLYDVSPLDERGGGRLRRGAAGLLHDRRQRPSAQLLAVAGPSSCPIEVQVQTAKTAAPASHPISGASAGWSSSMTTTPAQIAASVATPTRSRADRPARESPTGRSRPDCDGVDMICPSESSGCSSRGRPGGQGPTLRQGHERRSAT